MPSSFVSYFEPFIAAFAFATLPWSPAVLYGAYSASWTLNSVSGTMWFAIVPTVGPPHVWRSAALSMIQFIALRTWMSSNGGCVRFIVRYQVRSPEFWWKYGFRLGVVAYFAGPAAGCSTVARSS